MRTLLCDRKVVQYNTHHDTLSKKILECKKWNISADEYQLIFEQLHEYFGFKLLTDLNVQSVDKVCLPLF